MKPAHLAPPTYNDGFAPPERSPRPSASAGRAATLLKPVVEKPESSELEHLPPILLQRIALLVDPLTWTRLRGTSTYLRDALHPEAYGPLFLRKQGAGWDAEAVEDGLPSHDLASATHRRSNLSAALARRRLRLVTSRDLPASPRSRVDGSTAWLPCSGHTIERFWPGEALLPGDLRTAVGPPWPASRSGSDEVSHIVAASGELKALVGSGASSALLQVGDPGTTTPFCLCAAHSHPNTEAFAHGSWYVHGLAPRRDGQSVVTWDVDYRISGWCVTPGGLNRCWGPIDIDPRHRFRALQRWGSARDGIERNYLTEWQSSRDGLWLLALGNATSREAFREVHAHAALVGWAADAGEGPPCLVRDLGTNNGWTTAFFHDSRRLLSIGRQGGKHCLRLSTLDAHTDGEWQETWFGASARPIHAVDLAADQALVVAARHEQRGWLGGRGDDSLELWRLDVAAMPIMVWRMFDRDIMVARFSLRGSCLLVMPKEGAEMVLLDLAPTQREDKSSLGRPNHVGRRIDLPGVDWSLKRFSEDNI